MSKKTTQEFVNEANKIHGGKYRYTKTLYVNKRTKVCITCPTHGDFWQMPYSHLQGCGCKKCRDENLKTTYEEFIEKANSIHKEKYDYSLITKENFNGISSYVEIICPVHGVFRQKAIDHVKGKGCKNALLIRCEKQNRWEKTVLFPEQRICMGIDLTSLKLFL